MDDLIRLFIANERIIISKNKNLKLSKDEGHYLNKVMRIKIGKEILNPNGWIILEVGLDDHPNKVHAIFKNSNYKKVELIKDFNGDDRVLIAQS